MQLIPSITIAVLVLLAAVGVMNAAEGRPSLRLLYNSDTTNIFMNQGRPLDRATLLSFVDEVAAAGCDTFLLCQGSQTFYYPSEVGHYMGQLSSTADRAKWKPKVRARVENLERFLTKGVDPFALLVDRIHEKGMTAIFTFRPNEGHTVPVDHPAISQFWRDHPEWRLNDADPAKSTHKWRPDDIRTRLMNYAVPEVRARRLAEIEEAMTKYDFDGLELDFMRWPFYFKPDEIRENIPTMNAFVAEVRAVLDSIGEQKGRRLSLSVRVHPTLAESRAVGLDPQAWHQAGLLDSLVVSHFFKHKGVGGRTSSLDIAGYRKALPGLPVFGCIGYCPREEYRPRAAALLKDGAQGIYLFNFFCSRQEKQPTEPPFDLVRSLVARPDGQRLDAAESE